MLDFLFDPGSPFVWILIIAIISGAVAVISRPFASYIQFVYPNAKYEAIGNPYIHKQTLEKLVELESLDQFIEQVNTNKDYHIEGTTAADIQQQLDKHLETLITQMKKEHGKKMQGFFTAYIEFKHGPILKSIIRGLYEKNTIDYDYFLQSASSQTIRALINQISTAQPETISSILTSYGFTSLLTDLMESTDTVPLQLDSAVDSYLINQMKQVKVPYKCKDAIQEYLNRLTDTYLIGHILRAKHLKYHEKLCRLLNIGDGYEIPTWKFEELSNAETVTEIIEGLDGTSYYPSLKQAAEKEDITKSVQPFIIAIDQHMLTILRQLSQQYYTSIGPTLRFLLSKEKEIINLKIISKGISEHLPTDKITPLLITEVNT